MKHTQYETVVRFCKHTNSLVLAKIAIKNEEQDILCLHNDDIETDKKDVKEWLNEHGYNK